MFFRRLRTERVARSCRQESASRLTAERLLVAGTVMLSGTRALAQDIRSPLDRDAVIVLALARNPNIRSTEQGARAAERRADAEGKLPSPEIDLEVWQVPFSDRQGMLMAGLRQRFPALGLSLGPRAEAVRAEARAIDLARANIERDVRRRAAHAFADYLEASERVRLHAAHIDLAKRIVSAARARAEAGGPLGDVAQAEVDLAAITVEHEEARLRREGARSQIDALLGRPVDAELPDPALPTLTVPAWPLARIIEHAKTSRPEVQIARAEASANEARRSAAKREWIWPTVSAAALYFAPTSATSTSGAGVSVAVELPWLWGERKARFDAAALERSASITRAEGAELDVATEVASAWREAAAAALRVRAYDEQVLPASRKALDVAFAGYTSARTDLPVLLLASRSLIDAELARLIAAVTLEHALAELDAAAGLPVPRQPLAQWRMP